jgi:hypothetical protein
MNIIKEKIPMIGTQGGSMICGTVFGLLFVFAGIQVIRTERGYRVFSKSRVEVAGAEARSQGVLLLIIGAVVLAVSFFVR